VLTKCHLMFQVMFEKVVREIRHDRVLNVLT